MGIFKCKCGKIFKVSFNSIMSGHATSCGCYQKERIGELRKLHGKSGCKLFKIWIALKRRCLNPKDPQYKRYGGRGIIIFPIWQTDFQSFYDYVTALPFYNKKGYSIDRIDNDKGYFPGNLRWTNQHFQVTNSRKRIDNTSGYTGVYKSRGRWKSEICVKGRRFYFEGFTSPEEALIARNNYIIENKLFEYKIQTIKT